jgi:c-di-GMP-binding flagellar brake protein YcgR
VHAEAIMLDISEGGCGVKVPAQQGVELTPEQNYSVAFTLLDKEVSILCAVKKLDKGPEYTFLGLEFTTIPQQQKETLMLFLDFLKKHGAG